jgi:hypothetical protein
VSVVEPQHQLVVSKLLNLESSSHYLTNCGLRADAAGGCRLRDSLKCTLAEGLSGGGDESASMLPVVDHLAGCRPRCIQRLGALWCRRR